LASAGWSAVTRETEERLAGSPSWRAADDDVGRVRGAAPLYGALLATWSIASMILV
jgi:hypothetical protein